jgi:glycosyltransferase involved in cell wall biosynthesis
VRPEEFFAQIHLLVVPSLWHEPLGRIVLEAQANLVPVIASRRGGIPELIEEGKTGFLYEPDHPAELLEILRSLTPGECERMRDNCMTKREEFAPERIAGEYLKVYEGILDERTAR